LQGSHIVSAGLMAARRDNLQDDQRFRVLRLLQDDPELSQRKLAAAVELSVGGIHYVMKTLIDTGLVELGDFTAGPDKRRVAYVLTPKGESERRRLAHSFLARKRAELEALREEIDELAAEIEAEAPGATPDGGR
jgi:EPS-associated MarR family transcriptional regulator